MSSAGGIDGILLAAGESRRMGFPKPLLTIGEETYLSRLVWAMLSAVDRLIVVIGAHAQLVRPQVPRDPRVTIVENADFARGQLSSLKCGLTALEPQRRAILVHLIDHPKVVAATFGGIVRAFGSGDKPIVIARHDGHRGHPVVFGRAVLAELERAPEDQGARVVVNADESRVGYFDTTDPGVLVDLDTPADVTRAGLLGPAQNNIE
jgi:molybdenum cofactor cytidylyltransferase